MRRFLFDIRIWLGLIVGSAVLLLAVDVVREKKPPTAGEPFARIDQFIQYEMDSSHIPGVAMAVVEGERTVHARGFGEDGHGQPITSFTPFWIGSNTKSFTALAVMQLAEAGQIDLDAPVQRYLPEFQTADPQAAARITVRHLLNQTSGFSRADGIKPVLEERTDTLEETVAGLRAVQLNRPVGEKFEYSNLNFIVAGLIVERVSGLRWTEYVEQRIFAPIGMSNSTATLEAAEAKGLTAVHRIWFGLPVETEVAYLPGLAPTGWLYSSAEDMARYLSMYLQGGAVNGTRLLSAEGIGAMLAPATNQVTSPLMSHEFARQYGRGWFVGPFGAAEDARWHLGNLPAFTAWMVLLPERNQAVVVLINAGSQFEIGGVNGVMSRLPLGAVNILRGEEPPSGLGMTRFYIVFNAAALATLVVQVWSLARVAGQRPRFSWAPWRALVAVGPLVWELGVSLALLVGFPALFGSMTWGQGLGAIPDLTLVLLAVSVLWLLTGLVRTARLLQALGSARHTTRAAGGLRLHLPHAR